MRRNDEVSKVQDHPTRETLRRFVLGMTSPAENRAIVTHLLRRCSRCSQVLGKSLEGSAAILFVLSEGELS